MKINKQTDNGFVEEVTTESNQWTGEEWKEIFDEDKLKALYKEQKNSQTVVNAPKIYPNDPCPCGSGKKYKNCCGRK